MIYNQIVTSTAFAILAMFSILITIWEHQRQRAVLGLETKSKILQESDPSAVLDETQRDADGEEIFSSFFTVI